MLSIGKIITSKQITNNGWSFSARIASASVGCESYRIVSALTAHNLLNIIKTSNVYLCYCITDARSRVNNRRVNTCNNNTIVLLLIHFPHHVRRDWRWCCYAGSYWLECVRSRGCGLHIFTYDVDTCAVWWRFERDAHTTRDKRKTITMRGA